MHTSLFNMQAIEESCSAQPLKRQTPAQKAAGVSTRFLHVAGIDPVELKSAENYDALKDLFEKFGPLEEDHGLVVCAEKVSRINSTSCTVSEHPISDMSRQRFCWVRYLDVSSAVAATEALSNHLCGTLGGHSLHLSYADVSVPPPVPAVAILPGQTLGEMPAVPGLEVIPDFVSVEEENQYLNGLCAVDSACWLEGINRRVQVPASCCGHLIL